MKDFGQITSVIQTIEIIVNAMQAKKVSMEDIENVQLTINEINNILYYSEKLKFQKKYDLNSEIEYFDYIEEIKTLITLWKQSIIRRSANGVDAEFWGIYESFKYVEPQEIFRRVVQHFLNLPEALRIEFLSLRYRYTFLKNGIDFTENDYSLIEQHVIMMVNEVEKYRWLYEHLADYRSKVVLNGIIRFWFEFDLNKLNALTETVYNDYFDLDIVQCDENTVFVDCGAYIGDSINDYINIYGKYKRIYAYEITPSTYQALLENVSGYQNVIVNQKGVGSQSKTMYVSGDDYGAGNQLSVSGDILVEVVTLDEDISEPVSVIKMDVEGAEKEALLGASGHIIQDKPKLLISSYHLPEDIFEVPFLINNLRDDYKFYMRYNGHNGIWPCDYVIFAV